MASQFFVYILKCADGSFYTGITSNLKRRLFQHRTGFGSPLFTKIRLPVGLVYSEEHPSMALAREREKKIKPLSRLNKIKLIESQRSKGSTSDI